MTEKENLWQVQYNESLNENFAWENLNREKEISKMSQIWNSIHKDLEETIEDKKNEKLYYVHLERQNPNHGTVGYIDLVAATHDVAFPKDYLWDYDYDVRLSIKIEHEHDNKIRLTCGWKSIVIDIGYFERRPEEISKKHINKILNVLWYEL